MDGKIVVSGLFLTDHENLSDGILSFLFLSNIINALEHDGLLLTSVDVADDNLGSLVCKESCCFSSDTLTRTCDNSDLTAQHTRWVV